MFDVKQFVQNNSGALLSSAGVLFTGASLFFTVKATVKATRIVDEENAEREKYEKSKCTKKEVVRSVGKHYIPAGLCFAGAVGCIFLSNKEYLRKQAAIAAVAALSTRNLREYKEQVEKVISDKDKETISSERMKKTKMPEPEGKPNEKSSTTIDEDKILCYEAFSKTYFYSTIDDVHIAELNLNQRLSMYGDVNLASFFDELGVDMPEGLYEVGWNVDDILDQQEVIFIPVRHNTAMTANGKPCMVIDWMCEPVFDYMHERETF